MNYFIATKHDAYRQREFESGATVIDPWRYVRDQNGVNVRRLGENKPEMISLLVPSRGRPREFARMAESALSTATYSRYMEIVAYVDDDDETWPMYPSSYPFREDNREEVEEISRIRYLRRPRILLSSAWNTSYANARGNILMHCGDDLVFETEGWDVRVREAFAAVPDKILLVHGDDVSPNTDVLATHGFLHRRWIETIGYFVPPYFSCDWNDVWLTDVADMIGRRVKVPIVTEHMHYSFDKRERDETDRQREQRGIVDNVAQLYKSMGKARVLDADKLRAVMA